MKQRCLVLAFAVACAAGAGLSRAAEPARVAILPVVVNASEGHDYLRAGMADMLASRVGRAEGVAVTRLSDASLATTDPKKAREAGRNAGADYVLYGSFTAFGAGASLDLACTPTAVAGKQDEEEMPVRAIFVQSGTLGDIIPKLDGVAERVARFATHGEHPAPTAAAPVAEAAAPPQVDALLQRIEALERAVFAREGNAAEKSGAALREALPAKPVDAAATPAPVPAPAPAEAPPAAAPAAPPVAPPQAVESQDLRRGELREDADPDAFDPDRSIVR